MEIIKIFIVGVIICLLSPVSANGQQNDTISSLNENSDSSKRSINSTGTYAQYKINKINYSYKEYSYEKGDPYRPFEIAALSLFIPGLGQIDIDEYKRGFTFFGVAAGSISLFPIGFNIALSNYNVGRIVALSGLTGYLVTAIWSSIDANRVVKVNNLAWRESKHSSIKISLEPFAVPKHFQLNNEIRAGLCLKVRF